MPELKINNDIEVTSDLPIAIPVKSAPYSQYVVSGAVLLLDCLAVFGTGVATYMLYLGWDYETYSLYVYTSATIALLTTAMFDFVGLYNLTSVSRPVEQVEKILLVCAVVLFAFLSFVFALKISTYFSRVWVFSWFLCATLLIFTQRMWWFRFVRRLVQTGRFARNIAIIGGGQQAKQLLHYLDRIHEPWNRIIGIFDDRIRRIGPEVAGYPVLGTVDSVLSFSRRYRIDDIIVALPWSADKRLHQITNRLMELPIHIHLGSDLAGFTYPRASYSSIGSVPMLHILSKPLTGLKVVIKTLEDKILATLLIVLFSPLLLSIALAIKFQSKGPVIFRQRRHGFNNKVFHVFKFRSMYDAGTRDSGVVQTLRNDSRTTRLGNFLRRTSLDELPQLLNVLQGTMSLVGPRPHPILLDEEYAPLIQGYFARHRVKPGITGWAQVNGLRGAIRAPEEMRARVEHDIYYIENWSVLLDLKILVMTFFYGFVHENAY